MTLQPSSRTFPSFSLLSFDIYGTLIDWENGIETGLRSSPFFSSITTPHKLSTRKGLLAAYVQNERRIQAAQPKLPYSGVLAATFKAIVAEYGLTASAGATTNDDTDKADFLEKEATRFYQSAGHWSAFPDTVAGLQRLSKYYKYLVPLSNVDNTTVAATVSGPLAPTQFAAIYTAQDIGSYKPDPRNFEYLLANVEREFGVDKSRVLHVAESLYHDHVPASAMGIESVWVDRSGASMGEIEDEVVREKARFGWRVGSIMELAELVEEAFAKDGGKE